MSSNKRSGRFRWLRLIVLAAFAGGMFLAWQMRACSGLGMDLAAGLGIPIPDMLAPEPAREQETGDERAELAADAGPQRSAAPQRPCELYLDSTGLAVDGTRADVAQAVAVCKRAGKARLRATGGARAGTYDRLVQALERAGVPIAPGGSGGPGKRP